MVSAQHDVLLRYLEAYNAADDDALDQFVTPGYVHHNNADDVDAGGVQAWCGVVPGGVPRLPGRDPGHSSSPATGSPCGSPRPGTH